MTLAWRSELAALLARAVAESGPGPVLEALADEHEALTEHPDAPVPPFRPDVPVLGLVPCEAGTLGVLVATDGRTSVHVARTRDALLEQVRENVEPEVVVDAEPADAAQVADILDRSGLVVPAWFSGSGFTADDLRAACAAVLVAVS